MIIPYAIITYLLPIMTIVLLVLLTIKKHRTQILARGITRVLLSYGIADLLLIILLWMLAWEEGSVIFNYENQPWINQLFGSLRYALNFVMVYWWFYVSIGTLLLGTVIYLVISTRQLNREK